MCEREIVGVKERVKIVFCGEFFFIRYERTFSSGQSNGTFPHLLEMNTTCALPLTKSQFSYNTHEHTHILSLTEDSTHTHTLSFSLSLTNIVHALTHSLSLSPSLTHTHKYTHTSTTSLVENSAYFLI